MLTEILVLIFALASPQLGDGATANKSTKKLSEAEYIPIRYPGPTNLEMSNRNGILEDEDIPEECKNKNYCNIKPSNYPEERYNKMFKGTKRVSQATFVPVSFGDRQGDPEDIDNCETTVSYEPLYRVRSVTGDWRSVIQAPAENYLQVVRLETCKKMNSPCFTEFPLAPDVVTFCKQKYSVWEFLVDNGKGGSERIQTELPVCCSCHYKTLVNTGKRK